MDIEKEGDRKDYQPVGPDQYAAEKSRENLRCLGVVSLILSLFVLLGGLGSFIYGCSEILTSLIYWSDGPVAFINGKFSLVGFWGVTFGLSLFAIGVLEFVAGGTLAKHSLTA